VTLWRVRLNNCCHGKAKIYSLFVVVVVVVVVVGVVVVGVDVAVDNIKCSLLP
jgi:hypothetical protein